MKRGKKAEAPVMDVDFDPPADTPPDDLWQEVVQPEHRQFTGRTPPHSLEAEEYLLSSIMLDGGDVLPRCEAAGAGSDWFYLSAHGIVYDGLVELFKAGHSTDVAYLAEHLKSKKKLEEIGGLPFLTQVSSQIPTTAQSGYFIDKVKELHILRESIKAHTAAVEEAYSFTGNVREYLADQQERATKLIEWAARGEDQTKREFDPARRIERPNPIYTLAGTTISTPGNLTAIYSQAKTGKSSLIGAMIGAAMTNPTAGHDTLGIIGPNYAGHALLHFDTEQSPYDWQQLVRSALRRVGLDAPPKWLKSYNLTGLSAGDCRSFIEQAVKRAKKAFGGIHSIFIDGIADLVVDPNSPDECFPLVTRLQGMAIENNTAVVSILHMNPSSDPQANQKGRGHLGSQLERKAESNITMEKEGEVTKVWGVRQRGKTISKDDALCFSWSEEHQMHRSCAAIPRPKHAGGPRVKYRFEDMAVCFPTAMQPHQLLTVIHRKVSTTSGISLSAFKDLVTRACADGYLDRLDKGQGGFAFRRVDHPPS